MSILRSDVQAINLKLTYFLSVVPAARLDWAAACSIATVSWGAHLLVGDLARGRVLHKASTARFLAYDA